MDKLDVKILDQMQRDATLSVAALSERVNISKTACWRRLKQLEKSGAIRSRVTLLDPEKINLGVIAFAHIKTSRHDDDWFKRFTRAIDAMPEVLEFYRLSGDADYLLKIVAKDIKSYDEVYKKLIRSVDLLDVNSSFVMDTIRYSNELPLDAAVTK